MLSSVSAGKPYARVVHCLSHGRVDYNDVAGAGDLIGSQMQDATTHLRLLVVVPKSATNSDSVRYDRKSCIYSLPVWCWWQY